MNIIGTGLSGLVGSRIVDLLSQDFIFTNLSLETGVDITDKDKLEKYVSQSDAPWVFHFAAKTDVDGCENDRDLGSEGPAWLINVQATENLAQLCKKSKKHLLYISTDYVFDGQKDVYTEDDTPRPMSWYGITKYEGEKRVMDIGALGLIIRIANPYRAIGPGKKDFVHKILDRLDQNLPVTSPTDSTMTPTFIDDLGLAIQTLIHNNSTGIYHAAGGDSMTPYNAARLIASIFGRDISLIQKTTSGDFFKNRAPRPLRAAIKNAKITRYGINMSLFEDGLKKVKNQED